MVKIEVHNHHTDADPAPSFATDAEIQIADQLRHQLEEQRLARSAGAPPAPRVQAKVDERCDAVQ
jgi:hypothetical protein